MPNYWKEALRESFRAVPETCPAVDKAMEDATRLIKVQTEALRAALTEALERAITAEQKVEELEFELTEARRHHEQ